MSTTAPTLTLWTRAPLEKQAKLLVEAYNASHENQVELTVVPNDDYVAKVGAAPARTVCRTSSPPTSSTCPTGSKQGLFQDITAQHRRRCRSRTRSTRATWRRARSRARSTCCRSSWTCRCCSGTRTCSQEAGLDPEKAPANTARSSPTAAKAVQALEQAGHLRHGDRPELRRLPGLHLVPERLGRRRRGHERRRHGVAAGQRHGRRRVQHLEGPVGFRRRPAVARKDEAGPTWTAGFTEGKVGLMLYPATCCRRRGFDVGVAGIPGPERWRFDLRRRRRHRHLEGLREASAQAWNFLNWMMCEDAQVEVLAKNSDVVSRSDLASNEYAGEGPAPGDDQRGRRQGRYSGRDELPAGVQRPTARGSPWCATRSWATEETIDAGQRRDHRSPRPVGPAPAAARRTRVGRLHLPPHLEERTDDGRSRHSPSQAAHRAAPRRRAHGSRACSGLAVRGADRDLRRWCCFCSR